MMARVQMPRNYQKFSTAFIFVAGWMVVLSWLDVISSETRDTILVPTIAMFFSIALLWVARVARQQKQMAPSMEPNANV